MANSTAVSPEPVIMVHRGWKEFQQPLGMYEEVFRLDTLFSAPSSTTSSSDKSKASTKLPPPTPEFAFVNGTTPFRNKDPDIRKLVRGHVVKDTTRKKRALKDKDAGGRKLRSKKAMREREAIHEQALYENDNLSTDSSEEMVLATSVTSHVYSRQPRSPSNELDPHPGLSLIIYNITEIGNAMYPQMYSLRFNRLSPTLWFNHALRDEALFHALLYTTSSYAGLIAGSTESKESIVHFSKSVVLLRERLVSMCDVAPGTMVDIMVEGTARAVSCLAFTKIMRGNAEGWKTHMMGLKQMIEIRGGITQFSIGLQLKIHRADLMGATNYMDGPLFHKSNGLPSITSREARHSAAQTAILIFLDTLPISPDLYDSLIYMHILSQQMSIYTKTQEEALLAHTYALRYSLLPSSFNDWYVDPGTGCLDEVLRLGALLYIEVTPQEFTFSALAPANLVKGLSGLVLSVQMWNEREGVLVMWLLFMGEMCSRAGEDRIWFVAQVEKLTAKLGFGEWKEVKGKLENLWWVEGLHDKAAWEILKEVETLRRILSGERSPVEGAL